MLRTLFIVSLTSLVINVRAQTEEEIASLGRPIRCLECFGVKDDKECLEKGHVRQCRFNQDACEIELRRHEGWGGHIMMYKQCKQSKACDNNHLQNPRAAWMPSQCNPDNFNTVCRCCCYTDECNVAQEDCFISVRGCSLPPTSVNRGSISCTNGREFGSSCTVTCNSNSQLVGVATSYCRFDGAWTEPIARCEDIQCPPRVTLANGWYICTNSQFAGSQCTGFCRPGFKLTGSATVTCVGTLLGGRWNSLYGPRCTPLQCPVRGVVEGGVVTCSDERNVESRCRVECDGNRRLDGVSDSYCEDKGTWSHPLPTCILIQCPVRGSIVNGGVTCTQGVDVGSVCRATCDDGYQVDGTIESTCLNSGGWSSPLPRCIRIQCPPRGVVLYGVVDCDNGLFTGSTCSVVCAQGTRLVGADISVCQITGFWDVALPTCERIECPERGTIDNGVVSCNNKRFMGSVCIAKCNRGSRLEGVPNSVCLENGEWSNPLPSCQGISCSPLDFSLQPGVMSCNNDFFYQSMCSFKCNPGYVIIGAPRVSCRLNGLWTTRMPECRLLTCRPRGRIVNGLVVCNDGNNVGSACEATCNAGFTLVGTAVSTCLGNGRWNFRLPSCQPLQCPFRGTIVGGTVTCSNDYFYGSVCTAICLGGRALTGIQRSVCTAEGRWDVALPSCLSRPCSDQGILRHGSISCTNDWDVRSVCTFSCEETGYQLYPAGRVRNVCQANQLWSLPKPCCTRPCPPYAHMDLVLVLDSSSSIGDENWIDLTRFVANVIRSYVVAEDAANFAVFRYNREVDEGTQIFLNSYPDDVDGLIEAFNRIPYDGSGTFTGNALEHALSVSLTSANGNRPDVKDVVFVITDGKAADNVKVPADAIRATGAAVIVLGIEPPRGALDMDQLRDMAGGEENLVIASDGFAALNEEFIGTLSRVICGKPCE